MTSRCAPGQPKHSPAGIHIPVGCAKTGKGGHDHNAFTVHYFSGFVLRIRRPFDQSQPFMQPLYGSSGNKYTAFQRIIQFISHPPGNGRQQTMLRGDGLCPCIHQNKAACTIRIFGTSCLQAGMAEQCGLLIAKH
ncbi:hypothetical protein D3C81_1705870 [compost metagenome]